MSKGSSPKYGRQFGRGRLLDTISALTSKVSYLNFATIRTENHHSAKQDWCPLHPGDR